MYIFEENKLIKEIEEKQPKKVLLQLPEGLKKEGSRLVSLIKEKTNTSAILSGEPLWGACDIAIEEARLLDCDLIVIYGHAPFLKTDFPVIYLETTYETDIKDLLEKVSSQIKEEKIAIVASVQHTRQVERAKEFLESKGKQIKVPEGKGHAAYTGQILGCEYTGLKLIAKDIEAILVIGNKFHALGAALAVDKPVILLDPVTREITDLQELKEKIIRQRAVAISRVKDARKIGIIVGTKLGQKFGAPTFIEEKLKQMNKEYVVISMGEITNDKLINLHDIDAFVELACPRIAIDAAAMYEKPLITAREFAVVCEDITWEELTKGGFV